MNKGGFEAALYNWIFITLDLVFAAMLLFFVYHNSNGEAVYEQSYAKEIALLLDSARPGMEISLNIDKPLEFAEKNGKDFNSIFIVNTDDNFVSVAFDSNGGYKQNFFSNLKVDSSVQGDRLVLKILEGDK